jgi:hypothetical protein
MLSTAASLFASAPVPGVILESLVTVVLTPIILSMSFAATAPLILATLSVVLAAVSAYVDLQSHRNRRRDAKRAIPDQGESRPGQYDVSRTRRYSYITDLTIFVCGSGTVVLSLLAIKFEPSVAELAAGTVGAMIAVLGLMRLISRQVVRLWQRGRRAYAAAVTVVFVIALVFSLGGAGGGFAAIWAERPDTCLAGEWTTTSRTFSAEIKINGSLENAIFTGRGTRLLIGADLRGAFGDGTWTTYEAQVGGVKIVRRSNVAETFGYAVGRRAQLFLLGVKISGIEEQQVDGGKWSTVNLRTNFASANDDYSSGRSSGRVYDYVCTRSILTMTTDGQTANFQRK